ATPDSIINAVIDNADAALRGADPLVLSGSSLHGSGGIYLSGTSVHITESTFDGTGVPGGTATLLVQLVANTNPSDFVFSSRVINAPGTAVAAYGPWITLTNCEITNSGANGVTVGQGSAGLGNVSISNCNLTNNAGLAVKVVAGTATADHVWWG